MVISVYSFNEFLELMKMFNILYVYKFRVSIVLVMVKMKVFFFIVVYFFINF